MSTPITSIAWLGRRGWAVTVPLLAAGALVAGCGTTHAGSAAAGGGAPAATASSSASAPAPVPTVTGGTSGAGSPDCVGWPTGAPNVALSLGFQPVSVERCVAGTTTVAGKGQWITETLERSSTNLTGLISALRTPPVSHQPGIMCPALVIEPPQLFLVNGSGQKIIPRLPKTGCGTLDTKVLAQLSKLKWTAVSVRLVGKVPANSTPTPAASL